MPSSLIVNGRRKYVPGIYAQIDASALGGRNASVGGLALVADLRNFPQASPLRYNNARALEAFDAASDALKLLAKLAFSPSDDPSTRGGAAALFVVSPAPTTQATADLLNSAGTAAISFTTKIYGLRANRTRINASKTAGVYTFVVSREGLSETFNVTPPAVATLEYDDATGIMDAVDLTWGASTASYEWTRQFPAKVGGVDLKINTDWDQGPTDGTISMSIVSAGTGAAHAAAVTATITGVNTVGAALEEDLTFPIADNGPKTTTGSFGRIDQILVSTSDAAWVGVMNTEGSISFETAARSVDEVLTDLDAIPLFSALSSSPKSASIEAGDVEPLTGEDTFAAVSLRCDNFFIADQMSGSTLVTAEQAGTKAPYLASAVQLAFLGGSESAPSAANWQSALDALLDQDVQIVALLSDAASVQALLPAHCNDAALQGYERNAWAGATGGQTLQAVYDGWIRPLNSELVSVCADQVVVDHPNGTQPTLEPPYLALMLAAMQAGSAIGYPLTRNRPRVLDASQLWAPNLDADEAISKGLVILSYDRIGWYVARSVTSYLTDDNPILSEVSSFESVQTSVRFLREFLNFKIGEPAVLSTGGNLKALAEDHLRSQVVEGIIKDYRAVSVEDGGDTFIIDYEVAAIEPINFIKLRASIVRISG